MPSFNINQKNVVIALIYFSISFPQISLAQGALEEIIVTAQRREQSLQEVPISIETYTGGSIRNEGFRNMSDLALFTPSVNVDEGALETQVRVRGFGTSGFALTLEQSVPTFLDGVIVSRSSGIKMAFMDVASVEVLKGPQPVYFGQNAVAGAFNLRSARPTPEWEGYVNGEVGSFNRTALEAAIGGPITDTLGIRVAAKYDKSDGFLEDIIDGELAGFYKSLGGRVMLEWAPTDDFTATAKFEIADLHKLPEAAHGCLIPGSALRDRRGNPSPEGDMNSIWADPPKGAGTAVQHTPIDANCFGSNKGLGDWKMAPEVHYRFASDDRGMIDIREAANAWALELTGNGIADREDISNYTTYLDLNYRFANGIELSSMTAYSDYLRNYKQENHNTVVFARYQNREEDLSQWSQELRLSSPSGGTMEWMAGVYWQDEDYDFHMISHEATVRRGLRVNGEGENWQDTEWQSAFASLTYNFMDKKASLDLGGRYSSVKKTAQAAGYASQWVFDVFPCASSATDYLGTGNTDTTTCDQEPNAFQITEADTQFLLPGADVDNLWTFPYNRHRRTPVNWRGSRAQAIGITVPCYPCRDNRSDNDRISDTLTEKQFDPQVALRFRPTDDVSLYARWAQAFKAGGYDTAVSSIPTSVEEYKFLAENAEIFEIGAKGVFWDGRARYELNVYESNFTNLQLQSANPDPDSGAISTNAGGQRLRGLDLSLQAALTDRIRAGVSGAVLDSVMTDYSGARCSVWEVRNPDLSGCDPVTQRIDRTGNEAPYSPDWKLVFDAEYQRPLWGQFVGTFTAKAFISDGYFTDYRRFDRKVSYDRHGDINLSWALSNQEENWKISVFARNLLEARPSYHEELDVDPEGILFRDMSQNQFRSFGIKGQYSF